MHSSLLFPFLNNGTMSASQVSIMTTSSTFTLYFPGQMRKIVCFHAPVLYWFYNVFPGSLRPDEDLWNKLIEQPHEMSVTQTLMGSRFILPPQCRFLLSDISRLEPLLMGKFFMQLFHAVLFMVWTY